MERKTDQKSLDYMIRTELVGRGIKDAAVIEAMRKVPREPFFARDDQDRAFTGRAWPIGYGQTISEPYIVALMTSALELRSTDRVLEIGTGSAYQTAILALLCEKVYTIERVKPLLDVAFGRLSDLKIRNVHFRCGDGTVGWPEAAPFDKVLIAAAAPEIPNRLLLEQLKDGGVAVLPHGDDESQILVSITRQGDQLISKDLCSCRFVRLIGKEGWAE